MSDALDAIAVSGLLLARLRAIGIDPDRVLARALVPASRFEPGGKLATREFFATWHAIDEEPDSSGPPPSSRSPVEALVRTCDRSASSSRARVTLPTRFMDSATEIIISVSSV
jgi:hypothetical protein